MYCWSGVTTTTTSSPPALRGEWGYDGSVMTDWWMRPEPDPHFRALRDSAYRLRAQVDVLMPGAAVHFGTTRDDAIMDSCARRTGSPSGRCSAPRSMCCAICSAAGFARPRTCRYSPWQTRGAPTRAEITPGEPDRVRTRGGMSSMSCGAAVLHAVVPCTGPRGAGPACRPRGGGLAACPGPSASAVRSSCPFPRCCARSRHRSSRDALPPAVRRARLLERTV